VTRELMALTLGLVFAGVGGELFVRAAVGIAAWARIPAGVIGATVAAFATSTPEVSVAIGAALAEKPEIALGDGLGSNVVNVALVLGQRSSSARSWRRARAPGVTCPSRC
jgi:cation:H+ antiporter